MTDTEQLIKDHYATLPEPVKRAIGSFDWTREVFDIGRKHGMHIDRIGELQTEVMLVVLGLTSPAQFQDELFSRIEPNREIATEVSDEVNTRVFIRIRDFMKGYYEKEEGSAPAVANADVERDGELGSRERATLNSVGIRLDGDLEPAPVAETVAPVASDEEEVAIDHGALSFVHEPEPAPVISAAPAPVPAPKPQAQVFKSPITVVNAADAPKNFLDPYREPLG